MFSNCSNKYSNFDHLEGNKSQFQENLYFSRNEQFQKVVHFELKHFLTLILVGAIMSRVRRKRRGSWLTSLPGPKTYPIIGVLHHFSDLKRTFQNLVDWGEKYGKIYRIEGIFNEPYIFLNDATYAQAVLSSTDLNHVSKPSIPYDNVFGQFLRNGLLVSKGEYWKSHRRIVARSFTYKSFQNYMRIFNEFGKRVVDDLGRLFPKDKPDEVQQISSLIHCCSLKIICAAVMGLDASDEEDKDDYQLFYERFQRYKVISSEKALNPFYLIDFLWRLHPKSREYDEIIDFLNGITRKIIAKRTKINENSPTSRAMIDDLLESGMSHEEVLVELNTVIAAGFESTSLTIHYLLFLLALNPEHQKMCQEEIDDVFSDPCQCPNGDLTMDGLANLSYLDQCCLETLRLFPVIFIFQRKLESPLKLEKDTFIPSGTNVIIPTYTIHHNPLHFPNPKTFDPSRFDPNSDKKHPYAYIPFAAGIRSCVGMKFAMMEIKAVAAHILRHFWISTVDRIEDVQILPSIVMTPERDYRFKLRRRLNNDADAYFNLSR